MGSYKNEDPERKGENRKKKENQDSLYSETCFLIISPSLTLFMDPLALFGIQKPCVYLSFLSEKDLLHDIQGGGVGPQVAD